MKMRTLFTLAAVGGAAYYFRDTLKNMWGSVTQSKLHERAGQTGGAPSTERIPSVGKGESYGKAMSDAQTGMEAGRSGSTYAGKAGTTGTTTSSTGTMGGVESGSKTGGTTKSTGKGGTA